MNQSQYTKLIQNASRSFAARNATIEQRKATTQGVQTSGMNETEKRFARMLQYMQQKDKIIEWQYCGSNRGNMPHVFRLADRTHYTPDFYVVTPDAECYVEIKGAWVWQKNRLKWKIAADLYPQYRWEWWQWIGGEWKTEIYGEKEEAK